MRRLLKEQQWERSLSTSEEAIGDTHDDSPLSATVEGYSDGRILLRFPGASNPIPGGRLLTSGAIGKGESVLIDQSPSAILDIEGMPWMRPQEEEEEPGEPDEPMGIVVHLFVATESYVILDEYGRRQEMTGKHSYWLASGDKVLKVFESNEFNGDSTIVDKIIPDLLFPGYRLENHLFWVLSDTRFLIQLKLHDYTDVVNYVPGLGLLRFIKPQIFTALIDNWEIVASDLQTADDYIPFENPYPEIIYPPEFNDVLDWLIPRHGINLDLGISGAIPVVTEVQETYPSFGFSNINANRIPTRVQYVFRPQDAMGSSGSYDSFSYGSFAKTYTTGTPFEGSNNWTWAPLELNAIEREWQVFSPNGTKTVLSPRTAYNLIGTNYHMFTDTQPLVKNSYDILFFYIPELREGSVDPSELFGTFWVLQSALTGYPTYESNLFWLAAKSA